MLLASVPSIRIPTQPLSKDSYLQGPSPFSPFHLLRRRSYGLQSRHLLPQSLPRSLVFYRPWCAAFRLPEISVKYLHDLILEARRTGSTLTGKNILEEIRWREMSHSIDSYSAYSSCPSETAKIGIPPTDADLLPPLVTSIQQGTMASFPIRFNHADSYVGEGCQGRTVLVGDAAHTIHPLAGQGLNMGLADVQVLARCIETTILRGGDIGSV